MPNVFGRGSREGGDLGGVPFATPQEEPSVREDVVTLLLVAAFYVYALQRTYPPGS